MLSNQGSDFRGHDSAPTTRSCSPTQKSIDLNKSLPTPRTRPLDHIKLWKWEILTWTLTLIAIVAAVATITPHVDRPLPQWPFNITMNGLLSIYSIILHGCIAYILASCIDQLQWNWFAARTCPLYDAILYDNAGRGPWGSLKWLWKHHVRQPLTAFGAFLTLIFLAVDPMIQQLMVPVECTWPLEDINATLPRANYILWICRSIHIYLNTGGKGAISKGSHTWHCIFWGRSCGSMSHK